MSLGVSVSAPSNRVEWKNNKEQSLRYAGNNAIVAPNFHHLTVDHHSSRRPALRTRPQLNTQRASQLDGHPRPQELHARTGWGELGQANTEHSTLIGIGRGGGGVGMSGRGRGGEEMLELCLEEEIRSPNPRADPAPQQFCAPVE